MSSQALYYDIAENKWLPSSDVSLATKEIEDIPVTVVMEAEEKRWVWCSSHRRFELLSKTDCLTLTTAEGCEMTGLPALFSYNPAHNCEKVPVRWLVKHPDGSDSALVGTDVLKIRLLSSNEPNFGITPRRTWFSYGNRVYNMADGTARSLIFEGYPDDILPFIFKKLQDATRDIYGIRPAISEKAMTSRDALTAFIYHPYDLGCYYLSGYIRGMSEIPRDCKNTYYIFCEKLGIKPPKSLKKIYAKNPYALPMYRTLLELGFTDYNLMLPFFEGKQIGDYDFADRNMFGLPFLDADEENEKKKDTEITTDLPEPEPNRRRGDMITQAEIDALLNGGFIGKSYTCWERIKSVVDFFMDAKGEKVTAHRLLAYTKGGPVGWQSDVCRMLFDNDNRETLPQELYTDFLKHGFSHALHDRLVTEINRRQYGHEEIKYYPDEMDWECEVLGYKFELPVYTDDIARIGQNMRNCVASYIGDAKSKKCAILTLRRGEDYVACIEISGNGLAIRQALGNHNRRLDGEVLQIVNTWHELMLLRDENGYLLPGDSKPLDMVSMREFHSVQNRKNYALYPLESLLALPEAEQGSGYFRTLATKVVTSIYRSDNLRRNLLGEMPSSTNQDERELLQVRCPVLRPVADAAYAGNGEAQLVMSMLYQESDMQILPANVARQQFWWKKADEQNTVGFSFVLRHMEEPKGQE